MILSRKVRATVEQDAEAEVEAAEAEVVVGAEAVADQVHLAAETLDVAEAQDVEVGALLEAEADPLLSGVTPKGPGAMICTMDPVVEA